MIVQIIIFIISFFIFLFSLYLFSRDDFVLLRKNVSLEQIFNYAFISLIIGILSGRIIYVLFNPSIRYINPLVFFLFFYFPGLSLVGSMIGVSIYLLIVSQKKKIPRGRIYDIFFLSFLLGLACDVLVTQLFDLFLIKKISLVSIIIGIAYLVSFIALSFFFQKGKAKDGTVSMGSILIFSSLSILTTIFTLHSKKNLLFDKETILLGGVFITGVVLLIKQKALGRRR